MENNMRFDLLTIFRRLILELSNGRVSKPLLR
jgi:hypothetical protein